MSEDLRAAIRRLNLESRDQVMEVTARAERAEAALDRVRAARRQMAREVEEYDLHDERQALRYALDLLDAALDGPSE